MLNISLTTRFTVLIGLLLLSFTFSACNPDEDIPGYIHIDKINLSTDYTKEGSNRANIVDAWVYVDNSLQGVYKLPATFPVLKTGKHNVKIKGGVIVDGVETARAPYNFFTFYEQDVDFTPNLIKKITPSVVYYNDANTNNDGTVFSWLLDFENGVSLDSSANSNVNIRTVTDPALVYEGTRSGSISLDADRTYANIVSHDAFTLPKSGASVYLELNYNTNSEFYIGLIDEEGTEIYVLGLRDSKTEWKKLYVNLSSFISSDSNSQSFKLFFRSIRTAVSTDKPQIYLDNIKLLHSKA